MHSVHPSGLLSCKSNVPGTHSLQHPPVTTFFLHEHSAVSWKFQCRFFYYGDVKIDNIKSYFTPHCLFKMKNYLITDFLLSSSSITRTGHTVWILVRTRNTGITLAAFNIFLATIIASIEMLNGRQNVILCQNTKEYIK